MTKVWDKKTYLEVRTYCMIHKGTNKYKRVLTCIRYGIPPVIALYYPFERRIPKDWVKYYNGQLFYIAKDILSEHQNLIKDDIDIDAYNYIKDYLYLEEE